MLSFHRNKKKKSARAVNKTEANQTTFKLKTIWGDRKVGAADAMHVKNLTSHTKYMYQQRQKHIVMTLHTHNKAFFGSKICAREYNETTDILCESNYVWGGYFIRSCSYCVPPPTSATHTHRLTHLICVTSLPRASGPIYIMCLNSIKVKSIPCNMTCVLANKTTKKKKKSELATEWI